MKLFRIFCALFLLAPAALAQTADDLNEGFEIQYDSGTGSHALRWWARGGFTYLVEQTSDLETWVWAPFVEQPPDVGAVEKTFSLNLLTTPKQFYRLWGTNNPNDPLMLADFDGDGISNYDEIHSGTDVYDPEPFTNTDSETLADYWETHYFGNLSQDDYGDADGDKSTPTS